jgi:ferredoxin-NADP reductase
VIEPISLRLTAIRYVARDTCSFTFAAPDGNHLPAALPGAHLTLHLPNGLTRQYSLLHASGQPSHYEVGVKRDARSRGGSQYMHESLRVGSILPVTPPHNNFPLREDAPLSVFFAGGIGVTPMVAMIERLASLRAARQVHYACRSREDAAFMPELRACCDPQLHCDDQHAGRVLDIAGIVQALPRDAHLYCCGPGPMLATFEAACAGWSRDQVHVEYFTAKDAPSTAGGYTVELARTGKEFLVPAGKTILAVLREAGIQVTSSCEEGVCAACETGVLSGTPDHRDSILSDSERGSNRTMMICCSGSKTDRLVLDL